MPDAHGWSNFFKVACFFIFISGVSNVVSCFIYGVGLYWGSLAFGLLEISAALSGWRAAFSHSCLAARRFYYGLVSCGIVAFIVQLISLIIHLSIGLDTYCEVYLDYNYAYYYNYYYGTVDPNYTSECDAFKMILLALSISGLVTVVVCCTGCACCARAYWKALEHEEHHPVGGVVVVQTSTAYQPVALAPGQVYANPNQPLLQPQPAPYTTNYQPGAPAYNPQQQQQYPQPYQQPQQQPQPPSYNPPFVQKY